jgi:electron transport complex protein RnfG
VTALRLRTGLRVLLPVLLVAMLGTLLIHVTHGILADRIQAANQRREMQPVFDVMPLQFDNDLLSDRITLDDLEQGRRADIFRARRAGRPVGVVVLPVVARGYNGDIEMAVGIAYDGTLTGVHIVRHHETPGLGDQVHQQKSRWLDQFRDRSLSNTPPEAWAVAPDGGRFDGISGATITPRGVIRVIHAALARYSSDTDAFYR